MIGAACVDDVPHMTPAFGPSFSCYFKYFAFPPTAAVWTSELPYGSPSYTDPRLCRRRSLDHASRGSLRIQRQNQVSPPVIPVSTTLDQVIVDITTIRNYNLSFVIKPFRYNQISCYNN